MRRFYFFYPTFFMEIIRSVDQAQSQPDVLCGLVIREQFLRASFREEQRTILGLVLRLLDENKEPDARALIKALLKEEEKETQAISGQIKSSEETPKKVETDNFDYEDPTHGIHF